MIFQLQFQREFPTSPTSHFTLSDDQPQEYTFLMQQINTSFTKFLIKKGRIVVQRAPLYLCSMQRYIRTGALLVYSAT